MLAVEATPATRPLIVSLQEDTVVFPMNHGCTCVRLQWVHLSRIIIFLSISLYNPIHFGALLRARMRHGSTNVLTVCRSLQDPKNTRVPRVPCASSYKVTGTCTIAKPPRMPTGRNAACSDPFRPRTRGHTKQKRAERSAPGVTAKWQPSPTPVGLHKIRSSLPPVGRSSSISAFSMVNEHSRPSARVPPDGAGNQPGLTIRVNSSGNIPPLT